MNLIKLIPLFFLTGCNGLLGSFVDTSAIPGRPETFTKYYPETHPDPHPPTPRSEYDERFMVGGKIYTYEEIGFKNAREYARYHDRTDPAAPRFTADQYKSQAYRYAKSGGKGSRDWRISGYRHTKP